MTRDYTGDDKWLLSDTRLVSIELTIEQALALLYGRPLKDSSPDGIHYVGKTLYNQAAHTIREMLEAVGVHVSLEMLKLRQQDCHPHMREVGWETCRHCGLKGQEYGVDARDS